MQGKTVRIHPGEYSRPMLEIERKFLVISDRFKEDALSVTRIVQGFLNTHPQRTVRVRIKEEQGFITVKGKSNEKGTTRFEWEKEIPVIEAEALLNLCEKETIFEVDEFFGNNDGLIVAEIELNSEMEQFTKPNWLGREVTGELKYYNSQLSKQPYKNWKE